MRLLTIYPPRIPTHAATECRRCRFATTTTTAGTLSCRSLQLQVRPDWGCRDFQPGGDAAMGVTVAYEEPQYELA